MKSKGQQLIEKGIQLEDMSLIKMGNELLKKEQEQSTPINQPKGNGPVKFIGNKFKDDLKEAANETKQAMKKRNKGKTIYTREPVSRDERSGPIEIACQDCSKKDYVNPVLLKRDLDTNRMYYVCDKCLNSRREKAK